MIANQFRHEQPRDIDSACALLADSGGAGRVLSGGTWLVPDMVARAVSPSCVIDLRRLEGPALSTEGTDVVISAHATYSDVLRSPGVAELVPMVADMASGVTGGAQLRNLATLVGSACQATPSSDVPGCLVAAGATMCIASSGQRRRMPALDFFVGPGVTALGAGELVAAIVVPAHRRRAHGYVKVKHSAGSWPIATAAALQIDDADTVRLALGAVSGAPIAVEGSLDDGSETLVQGVIEQLVEPWEDALADAGYRRRVAPVVARRALALLEEARG